MCIRDRYFIIDEKNNTVELTEKGIDLLSRKTDDPLFFVLPDIGTQLAELENENLTEEEKIAKKDELLQNYAIKSERVHTINQSVSYTHLDVYKRQGLYPNSCHW